MSNQKPSKNPLSQMMGKNSPFAIYKEDTDPIIHQLAKLILTSVGGWITVKLIEAAYNAHFDLNPEDKEDNDNA